MTESGRKRLLVGVLGVLVLALALRLAGMAIDTDPEGEPVPRRVNELSAGGYDTPGPRSRAAAAPPRRARRASEEEEAVTEVLDLDLHLLDRQARSYRPGRDPWRFGEPPPPPPPEPPPPSAEELARIQADQERLARMQAEQAERQRQEALIPKPQPFTMKFIGSFGPAQRRLAVFSDGQNIFNAREGEVLQEKFIVARIGYESVDIQFVGFPAWPAQRLAVGR